VTNANKYNMEVHFVQGYGKIADDDFWSNPPEQTWISTARNDTDGQITDIFDRTSGASNLPNTCYEESMTSDRWGRVVSQRMGLISESTSGRYDYEIFSWEDDAGERCRWDNGDANRAYNWGLGYPTNDAPSVWTQKEDANSFNNTSFRWKHTWRYWAGNQSNPLDFGSLTTGTKFHVNTNASAPTGADASLGYKSEWTTGFRPGNDVTYKFVVPAGTTKRVTISTDNTTTNTGMVDSYLYLLNSSKSIISFNDDGGGRGGTSKLTKDLCPGTYYIGVDGFGTTHLGAFKLEVTSSDLSVTPGTIAISTSNDLFIKLCPNELIPAISSTSTGTSTLGTITYKWMRFTYNNGAWSNPTEYTAAGTGPAASSLGTMGTDEVVGYYRIDSDCGTSAKTASAYFSKHVVAIAAGSIGSDKTVPFPHEVSNGSATSITNASSSPNQLISWEKNVNSNGWVDADNSTNTQTYALPDLVNKSTQFRRKVTNSCSGFEYSAPITVSVIKPNGVIVGKVSSKTGGGVNNVTISILRETSLPGGEPIKLIPQLPPQTEPILLEVSTMALLPNQVVQLPILP
jgi:hypothetical protein